MKLGEKQEIFSSNLGDLLSWCWNNGYRVRCGEVHRTPEMAKIYAAQGKGITKSLHIKKLAADLFIRRAGSSELWDHQVYAEVAVRWKALHPLNRWGGDFKSRDSVHFSMEHGGIK